MKFRSLLVALGMLAGVVTASAQPAGDIRLYCFTSGMMNTTLGFLQNGSPMEKYLAPVSFFVVKHPKGVVLFDTGNNDKLITDTNYWPAVFRALVTTPTPSMTPEVAIDVQLAKIGVKPEDVRYVVMSHLHMDHAGNIGKFKKSTFIIQRDEIHGAFWPEPGTASSFIPADFMPLRVEPGTSKNANAQPVIELAGDHDVFGDGTLVVKRWPGHTVGSQMMTVKLKNTGTILLTGDTIFLRENVEKNIAPNAGLAWNATEVMRSYEYVRNMMASEKYDYFTSHDREAWKAMKHAPAFYD